MEKTELYTYLILSMIGNVVLLICLLSPNIAKFFNRRHLTWKDDKTSYIQGAIDYCDSPDGIGTFIAKRFPEMVK